MTFVEFFLLFAKSFYLYRTLRNNSFYVQHENVYCVQLCLSEKGFLFDIKFSFSKKIHFGSFFFLKRHRCHSVLYESGDYAYFTRYYGKRIRYQPKTFWKEELKRFFFCIFDSFPTVIFLRSNEKSKLLYPTKPLHV